MHEEPPTLAIATEAQDGLTHVRLVGELDFGTAAQLVAELERLSQEDRRVVLDLRGLMFMDSSGLAVILRFHRRARDAEWDLVVIRGPEPVDRVFRMTRTDAVLGLLDVPPSPSSDPPSPAA